MPPWDDGYPSGGNYWSDYASRYPNATEIGSSGIGDTEYLISVSPRRRRQVPANRAIRHLRAHNRRTLAKSVSVASSLRISKFVSDADGFAFTNHPETTPMMLFAGSVGAAVAAILIKKKQVRTKCSVSAHEPKNTNSFTQREDQKNSV